MRPKHWFLFSWCLLATVLHIIMALIIKYKGLCINCVNLSPHSSGFQKTCMKVKLLNATHSWHKNSDIMRSYRAQERDIGFFSPTATYSCVQVHHQELKKHRKLCVHACQVIDTRARSCFSSYFWLGRERLLTVSFAGPYRQRSWHTDTGFRVHEKRAPIDPNQGAAFNSCASGNTSHSLFSLSLSPLQPVLPAIARLQRTSEV